MKARIGAVLAMGLLVCVSAAPAPVSSGKVTGDYVEARTASVFAGACHYNGELVTTGCDAIMAWNIHSGTWNGTELAGVRAMGAVTSDANLGEQGSRKCELVIDTAASGAQAAALVDLLRTQYAGLGEVVAVRRGAVNFLHDTQGYMASVTGFATVQTEPMPDAGCCKQPNLVWYTPLVKLENRKVGYTEHAAYMAGTLGDPWQREAENDAFYGTFSY